MTANELNKQCLNIENEVRTLKGTTATIEKENIALEEHIRRGIQKRLVILKNLIKDVLRDCQRQTNPRVASLAAEYIDGDEHKKAEANLSRLQDDISIEEVF